MAWVEGPVSAFVAASATAELHSALASWAAPPCFAIAASAGDNPGVDSGPEGGSKHRGHELKSEEPCTPPRQAKPYKP